MTSHRRSSPIRLGDMQNESQLDANTRQARFGFNVRSRGKPLRCGIIRLSNHSCHLEHWGHGKERTRRTLEGTAAVCARLRPDTDRLADPAQGPAKLERRLDRLVATAAPTTLSRLGCGTHHTATLLVAAGENIDRLGSEASFAHLCATAPVPASPTQLRRQPRRQPRFAHGRHRRAPLLRTNPQLHRTPPRRRQDQKRSHPLPQALRRPRALPHPPRRPLRPHNPHLTSIGTSTGRACLRIPVP